jgi:outer membrane protein assembly factor BamB
MQRYDAENTGFNSSGTPLKSDVEVLTRLGVSASSGDYLLADGRAFVHTDTDGIGAVSIGSGDVGWTFDPSDSPTIPEFAEGDIIAARSLGQSSYVLDQTNGAVETELETGPGIGLGYAGDARWFAPRFDGTIVAGEGGSGELRWETPLDGIGTRPAVSDGRVFVATIHDTDPDELQFENPDAMDAEGRLYALDAADGSVVWEASRERFGFGSPVVHDGTVYWTGTDGNVIAHDAETGDEQWRYTTDGSFHRSPAVTDNYLVAGNDDGRLYAMDPRSGDEIGTAGTDGPVRTAPVIVDDTVYFGSDGNTVYALEIGSGGILWEFDTDAPVRGLVAGHGRVIAGTPSETYILGQGGTGGDDAPTTERTETTSAGDPAPDDQSESGDPDQQRGFLTNDPESSLAFLDDPVSLTWAGIGVSIAGIVIQLFGRQS